MREERVRNKTKNGGVRSLREERVRNRTKNGRVRSLREERVRNWKMQNAQKQYLFPVLNHCFCYKVCERCFRLSFRSRKRDRGVTKWW